jgi:hypothetical protein
LPSSASTRTIWSRSSKLHVEQLLLDQQGLVVEQRQIGILLLAELGVAATCCCSHAR